MKSTPPWGGSFDDWVAHYEARTGLPFRFLAGESLLFDPQHGFATFGHSSGRDALEVGKICGDSAFWSREMVNLARLFGYEKLRGTACSASRVRLFQRAYDARVVGYVMETEVRRDERGGVPGELVGGCVVRGAHSRVVPEGLVGQGGRVEAGLEHRT